MSDRNEELRKSINKVEGYDPQKELVTINVNITNPDTGEVEKNNRSYLPLSKKREWFKLKYPEGRIVSKVVSLREQITPDCNAIHVETFIYADSLSEVPIAYDEAWRILEEENENEYYVGKSKSVVFTGVINAAKAKAESNALYKLGFGFQLESQEEADEIIDKEAEEKLATILPAKEPPKIPKTVSKPASKPTKAEKFKENVSSGGTAINFDPSISYGSGGLAKKPEGGKEIDFKPEPPQAPPKSPEKKEEAPNVVQSQPKSKDYEEAILYPCSMDGYETLGDAANAKPSAIIWLEGNTKDEKERNYCKIIIENDEIVKAVAERKKK